MSALICLATCNGGRWLSAQLESILAQTDGDWRLLISDDQSTDDTRVVIDAYQRRDTRIELLPPRRGSPGPVANFDYLLRVAQQRAGDADRVALCDQDDIWDPVKLQLQRAALGDAQGCYSDLLLIDAAGREIAPSLHAQLRAPAQAAVEDLLAQNSVVGCTLALRPAVLDIALPFPPGLMNHDWWLALCALALGDLRRLERPLVRYRQHGDNQIGSYRPLQQTLHLPALLARQRKVIRGQLLAVSALAERLAARDMQVPDALPAYRERVGAMSMARRVAALARGEFAAPQLPLRCLRSLAAIRSLD